MWDIRTGSNATVSQLKYTSKTNFDLKLRIPLSGDFDMEANWSNL